MLQPAKVATPELAASGLVVQLRVAPPGVVSASVTDEVSVLTTLPSASSTDTAGWVANAVWLMAVELGSVVNASFAAAPALTTVSDIPDPHVDAAALLLPSPP